MREKSAGIVLGAVTISAFLTAAGCMGFLPAPTHVDRVRQASEQERTRCVAQPADPRLFGPDVVEGVAPFYLYVNSANNREARLHGAEIRLRPLPGMTPELVGHDLMCHSAQVVLGHAQSWPNDPYWLPDGWVKISVRSDDSSFVVALDGEDIEEAKEILARAKAFAGRQ
jgi:hypothetical protein